LPSRSTTTPTVSSKSLLHKLENYIRLAARVASAMAHWRFEIAELAAALPAGNYARNGVTKLLGKPDLAAAEPAFYAIFYDVPEKWDAPAFTRMAHVAISSLEEATKLVTATEGSAAMSAAFYRARNPVVVDCRAIPTTASGTNLWARDIAEAQASEE
jgi:hypothetical protein